MLSQLGELFGRRDSMVLVRRITQNGDVVIREIFPHTSQRDKAINEKAQEIINKADVTIIPSVDYENKGMQYGMRFTKDASHFTVRASCLPRRPYEVWALDLSPQVAKVIASMAEMRLSRTRLNIVVL